MNQKARSSNYFNSSRTPSNESDLGLIQKIIAKDENALEELYLRYSLSLYNYVLRIIYDPIAAEDVLQEVFIGVWTGSGQFQGHAKVKTWLFRITHYQTASWLRGQKGKFVSQQEDVIEEIVDHEAETPETLAFAAWNIDQIRNALQKLSAKHREVIELSFSQGFSNSEIATILECPVGTVKSRLHNGLRVLNSILNTQGFVNKDRE